MRIPFRLLPASWGLRGKPYLEAEAHYYLDGEPLERRLIVIRENDPIEQRYFTLDVDFKYHHISRYDYDLKHAEIEYENLPDQLIIERLDIDLIHGKIARYDHDVRKAELTFKDDPTALALAKLDIELHHHKIDERKYHLQSATLKHEPYVSVVKSDFDHKQGMNGLYFEFDWNELWIEYLRLNGYVGTTEDEVVEQWFRDVCRAVVLEEGEYAPENTTINPPGPIINRIRRDGGTEYS